MTEPDMTEREVAWWLSVEPLGSDAVWALTRVADGRPPDGPLGAGLLPGIGFVKDMVVGALPVKDAAPWRGALVDRAAERELARTVGRVLLPYELRKELLNAPRGQRHTVSVAVRGWLAQVPWDALAIDDAGDRRLVECATVVAGLPATLHVGRARLPDRGAASPVLRVVDPGPPEKERLLPGGTGRWENELCLDGEYLEPLDDTFSRRDLGARLREHPARLVYYGHAVPGADEAPAAAGLLLSDRGGQPDVFTAFDWLAEPALYPAPPRVAVIACGSDDSTLFEQSGIPVAAINAGAELLTATRWILPVDQTLKGGCPTMALGMAVDTAHAEADPLAAVRRWQIRRLQRWRDRGEVADTPLLWTSRSEVGDQ